MKYEQRDNSGTLFKNDKKEKETHADYRGTALISGVEYYINAWVKEGKNGKFFSVAFKEKGDSQPRQRDDRPVYDRGTQASKSQQPDDFLDDSVPY